LRALFATAGLERIVNLLLELHAVLLLHHENQVRPLNLFDAENAVCVGREASGVRLDAGPANTLSAVGLRSLFLLQTKSTRRIGGIRTGDG
jgi:hypothetical protein